MANYDKEERWKEGMKDKKTCLRLFLESCFKEKDLEIML